MTVGPADMALYIFTKAISEGRPIDVYNHGRMRRDFTYVDDIVEAMVRLLDKLPSPIRTLIHCIPIPVPARVDTASITSATTSQKNSVGLLS